MLWVYGHYKSLVFSAGEGGGGGRQILTSKVDPRAERINVCIEKPK